MEMKDKIKKIKFDRLPTGERRFIERTEGLTKHSYKVPGLQSDFVIYCNKTNDIVLYYSKCMNYIFKDGAYALHYFDKKYSQSYYSYYSKMCGTFITLSDEFECDSYYDSVKRYTDRKYVNEHFSDLVNKYTDIDLNEFNKIEYSDYINDFILSSIDEKYGTTYLNTNYTKYKNLKHKK